MLTVAIVVGGYIVCFSAQVAIDKLTGWQLWECFSDPDD